MRLGTAAVRQMVFRNAQIEPFVLSLSRLSGAPRPAVVSVDQHQLRWKRPQCRRSGLEAASATQAGAFWNASCSRRKLPRPSAASRQWLKLVPMLEVQP